MEWLKGLFLSSFIIFFIPFISAEIDIILPEKEIYNLGDILSASASIVEDTDYQGFLKTIILCEKYNLQYFTTPLNIESNFRTQIKIPDLPIFASMQGVCNLRAEYEDTTGDKISSVDSNPFVISDELNISTEEIIETLPNETITIEGSVKKLNGENLQTGNLIVSFKNKDYESKVEFGKFTLKLPLNSDLEIGRHPALIKVEDKFNNYADILIHINILPIATRIENMLDSSSINPKDGLSAKIILYDHNNNAMSGSINVDLIGPDGNKILTKLVKSSGTIKYQFNNNELPGTYTIKSSFENINEISEFEILEYRQISMRYEDEVVYVENIGNVHYEDETTIVLEGDEKKYLINKKIDLKPGETVSFDLSKEVPSGNYDIILQEPEEFITESERAITDAEELSPEDEISFAEEGNIIEDVSIIDRRPFYKKFFSVVGLVTGAAVKTGGYVASRPLLASIILIVIILVIVFYYSKELIFDKMSKKKSEDNVEVFKDFKFEEKKE